MATQKKLLIFYILIVCILKGNLGGIEARQHPHHRHVHHHAVSKQQMNPSKLFVFGDSYADTGNTAKSLSGSWKEPYGVTFPGKPVGRFSDGRIQTDYLARFLGLKSPLPYRMMRYAPNASSRGMNFAYGGTGVFDTDAPFPNVTTQIDFFKQLIMNESVYTRRDIQDSVALFSLSGNDYNYYLKTKGFDPKGLQAFIVQVVAQQSLDLQRIYDLGVRKIVVSTLQPLGCLPQMTVQSSFQQCNTTENQLVQFHNQLLQTAVATFNNQTKDGSTPFLMLNLYDSFMSVLQPNATSTSQVAVSASFKTPLIPCCAGKNTSYACGSVDANGNNMYTVCKDPESAFFWDGFHPTQAGWRAVYSTLRSNLQEIYT